MILIYLVLHLTMGVSLLKEVDHQKFLENITHIYFSHEHPDHFQFHFLSQFQKKEDKIL